MLGSWDVQTKRVMAILSLGLLAGCDPIFSPVVRYKIEIEVNDHGTVRRGSSVWSIERTLFRESGVRFRGDAVAVDLSGGRTLFALTVGQDGQHEPTSDDDVRMLPSRLFGDSAFAYRNVSPRVSRTAAEEMPDIARMLGRSAKLDCTKTFRQGPACPLFVYFKDISAPSSVRSADPNRLQDMFGGDVSLKSLTVTITDNPVTRGIEKRFPWWDTVGRNSLDGRNNVAHSYTDPLAMKIGRGEFSS